MTELRRRVYLSAAAIFVGGTAGCLDGGSGGDGSAPPDPIERNYAGGGSERVDDVAIELEGPTGIVLQHDGRSAFHFELRDDTGDESWILARGTGSWTGANLIDIDPGGYAIDVDTDGVWELTVVEQPRYTAEHVTADFPISIETIADDFYGPIALPGPVLVDAGASGEAENRLEICDSRGAVAETVLDTDGPAEVERVVSIDDDVGWIDVRTSGFFELSISRQGTDD